VFLIGDDDKVAVQRVNLGPIEDGMALIDSGLQAGQRVVLDGQSRLRAGVQVGAAASTDVSQD
jgi:membrane fusion protein, multidrug efflux system